jgi:hypothetical protein
MLRKRVWGVAGAARLGLVVLAVCTTLAMLVPVGALADADPPSDFLPDNDLYLPYQPPVARPVSAVLNRMLKAARSRHHVYKVALVATPQDLGAVTVLFRKPAQYVRFLYREIQFVLGPQRATLLIAMPGGLGVIGPDATAAGRAALRRIRLPARPTSNVLARAAITAVRTLTAVNHHPVR